MALTTIANGDNPSGTILNANLVYLEGLITGGQAIKIAAFSALRTTAAAAPTTAFICIASDFKKLYLYCGDATQADGGFITLADWSGSAVNTAEVG